MAVVVNGCREVLMMWRHRFITGGGGALAREGGHDAAPALAGGIGRKVAEPGKKGAVAPNSAPWGGRW